MTSNPASVGRCANKKLPGGCPLPNVQCGYPDCDASVGPAPDGEGWIEWSGGENPAPGQRVDTRHLRGDECADWLSDQWGVSWLCEDPEDGENIIAYRIAPHPDREAEPTGGVVVPRAAMESAMRIIRAFSPQSAAATAIEEALSVSPPDVKGGLGALRASPCIPTEGHEAAVVALLDQISAVCTSFNDQTHDADDTLGKINQLAYAGIAALRPGSVRTGP